MRQRKTDDPQAVAAGRRVAAQCFRGSQDGWGDSLLFADLVDQLFGFRGGAGDPARK